MLRLWRRQVWTRGLVAFGLAALLASCSPGEWQFGSRTLSFPGPQAGGGNSDPTGMPVPTSTSAAADRFGRGPVPVTLLLPLTGEPGMVQIGTSLANASRLAISFIDANPNIGENITITLRDSGTSVAGATHAANAAVAEGAKLILGPLQAEQVSAAGAVARASGVPLIGFSNTVSSAGPGIYLLSVTPDMEMKRAVSYLRAQGRRGLAGAFPTTPYGEAQALAFRQQATASGAPPNAVYMYSSPSEIAGIVAQAKPLIDRGMIDALFIPERGAAPAFGQALAQAGVTPDLLQLAGSAEWAGDPAILASPGLRGAIYPAVDEAGLNAITPDYQARFGGRPHPLATLAYTATILANVNTLSLATPPYNPSLMTNPTGFNGRDGLFRFGTDGRSEYALAIKQIGPSGVVTVEGPKL